MIVADVNVIAYFLIIGDKTKDARRLYQTDPFWAVPTLWKHEFLNVLATYVKHGGGLQSDATQIWKHANTLFTDNEHEIVLKNALQLAIDNNISAYDAQYVALAIQLGLPLITEDRKLQLRFPNVAMSTEAFL